MYKSKHWTVDEWDCLRRGQNDYAYTDGDIGMLATENEGTAELFRLLDALREQNPNWICNFTNAGYKSGYRTPEVNTEVGGEYNSTHMRGIAADMHIANADYSGEELAAMVEETAANLGINIGLGIYDGWVHVDTAGGDRRW